MFIACVEEASLKELERQNIGSLFPLWWRLKHDGCVDRGWTQREPQAHILAYQNGGLIGHIALSDLTLDKYSDITYGLSDLAVAKPHRNNGVATELISYAISAAVCSYDARYVIGASQSSRVRRANEHSEMRPIMPEEVFYLSENHRKITNPHWMIYGKTDVQPAIQIRHDC